jgi:hypothetical protein
MLKIVLFNTAVTHWHNIETYKKENTKKHTLPLNHITWNIVFVYKSRPVNTWFNEQVQHQNYSCGCY